MAQAVFDQRMEAGMAPGALVVPVGGVEDASVAVGADPRPRLTVIALHAFHQHRAVGVVVGVDVRLVPRLERRQALHHRMAGLGDFGGESGRAVFHELCPDERDIIVRVAEAVGGAVDRKEPFTRGHKVEQRLFLRPRDRVVVGVKHQGIEVAEPLPVEIGRISRVGEVDAVFREGRGQERHVLLRVVVLAVVAEEQHLDLARLGVGGRRRLAGGQEQQEQGGGRSHRWGMMVVGDDPRSGIIPVL